MKKIGDPGGLMRPAKVPAIFLFAKCKKGHSLNMFSSKGAFLFASDY